MVVKSAFFYGAHSINAISEHPLACALLDPLPLKVKKVKKKLLWILVEDRLDLEGSKSLLLRSKCL